MGAWQHFFQLYDWVGRPDAGDYVFALRVHHELTPEFVFAGGRVACERHTGTRVCAGVTEYHRLHVYSRAPLGGDVVLATVDNRAIVHP